jgi:hypothetical protein
MNLQLTPMRFEKVLDDKTMLDYITNKGYNVIERNRKIFGNQNFKEVCLNGYYFTYHKYFENGLEFATLQPYQLDTCPVSKRTFCFGCMDISKQEAFMFFKGKKMASDRPTAIMVYNELKKYLEPQESFLAFSIKF